MCVKLRRSVWDTAFIFSVWDTVLILSLHNLGTKDVSKVSTVCRVCSIQELREVGQYTCTQVVLNVSSVCKLRSIVSKVSIVCRVWIQELRELGQYTSRV